MASQAIATTDEQPARQLSDRRESYAIMKDKARMFAMSPLIPESLRGKDYDVAVANCLIALELANVMGEAPLVVMQNIHIVKGKAGFAAQYMIARANSSGVFKGRINWRLTGKADALSVEAYATLADTGEEVAFTADMAMARAEGWTSNPKYKTMPELMLRYRSATFLVRLYAPDVMLGYHTAEEYQDVTAAPVMTANRQPLTAAALLGHEANDGAMSEQNPNATEGRDDNDRGERTDVDDVADMYRNATTPEDIATADMARNKLALHDDLTVANARSEAVAAMGDGE
ncbi:hypothetical protein O6V14_04780 [Sphingomonas faeni]|uniref:hypothetical protein n=1 Tax=Sphingomonas faeni TaxID=185950 RepID=UPI0033602CAE